MTRSPPKALADVGLASLRRPGAVSSVLFLYECATEEVFTLRPVAERLGLTVQAVSHLFRQLAARGLVEVRDGRYRPTVAGYARLEGALTDLGEEVARRLEKLKVVRSARAVALLRVFKDKPVTLELKEGVLVARPGSSGPSRGIARASVPAGGLVEVGELEGIVPIAPGAIRVFVVRSRALAAKEGTRRVREAVRVSSPGVIAAQGLEAYHLLGASRVGPVLRFAAPAAAQEAARLGVNSAVFVTAEELPRFLSAFASPSAPTVEVIELGSLRLGRPRAVTDRGTGESLRHRR